MAQKLPNPTGTPTNSFHYRRTIYHSVMTPKWLLNNADLDNSVDLSSGQTQASLELKVKGDVENYDHILTVGLVAPNVLPARSDVIVKINIALEHSQPIPPPSPPPRPLDPLCVTIADGWPTSDEDNAYAFGFQIQDPTSYKRNGPYLGIEGKCAQIFGGGKPDIKEVGKEALKDQEFVRWPQLFQITLLPTDKWGSCYSAIAGGHTISTLFNNRVKVEKGLYLSLFRNISNEIYTINFIEVEIFLNPDYPKA